MPPKMNEISGILIVQVLFFQCQTSKDRLSVKTNPAGTVTVRMLYNGFNMVKSAETVFRNKNKRKDN